MRGVSWCPACPLSPLPVSFCLLIVSSVGGAVWGVVGVLVLSVAGDPPGLSARRCVHLLIWMGPTVGGWWIACYMGVYGRLCCI